MKIETKLENLASQIGFGLAATVLWDELTPDLKESFTEEQRLEILGEAVPESDVQKAVFTVIKDITLNFDRCKEIRERYSRENRSWQKNLAGLMLKLMSENARDFDQVMEVIQESSSGTEIRKDNLHKVTKLAETFWHWKRIKDLTSIYSGCTTEKQICITAAHKMEDQLKAAEERKDPELFEMWKSCLTISASEGEKGKEFSDRAPEAMAKSASTIDQLWEVLTPEYKEYLLENDYLIHKVFDKILEFQPNPPFEKLFSAWEMVPQGSRIESRLLIEMKKVGTFSEWSSRFEKSEFGSKVRPVALEEMLKYGLTDELLKFFRKQNHDSDLQKSIIELAKADGTYGRLIRVYRILRSSLFATNKEKLEEDICMAVETFDQAVEVHDLGIKKEIMLNVAEVKAETIEQLVELKKRCVYGSDMEAKVVSRLKEAIA